MARETLFNDFLNEIKTALEPVKDEAGLEFILDWLAEIPADMPRRGPGRQFLYLG